MKEKEKARTTVDDRSWDELKQEGVKVSEMIQFSSVVPERENLPYYLISMPWFKNWQAYTGCAPKNDSDDEMEEPQKGKYPGCINQSS